MITYADIIRIIEASKPTEGLFIPIFYGTGTHEWFPVNKAEYLNNLKGIHKPETVAFPCLFQIEGDGEMFLHPKSENGLDDARIKFIDEYVVDGELCDTYGGDYTFQYVRARYEDKALRFFERFSGAKKRGEQEIYDEERIEEYKNVLRSRGYNV
jgi:hypothetical protein